MESVQKYPAEYCKDIYDNDDATTAAAAYRQTPLTEMLPAGSGILRPERPCSRPRHIHLARTVRGPRRRDELRKNVDRAPLDERRVVWEKPVHLTVSRPRQAPDLSELVPGDRY